MKSAVIRDYIIFHQWNKTHCVNYRGISYIKPWIHRVLKYMGFADHEKNSEYCQPYRFWAIREAETSFKHKCDIITLCSLHGECVSPVVPSLGGAPPLEGRQRSQGEHTTLSVQRL